MKILLADNFADSHAKALSNEGHLITFNPDLEEETLVEAISDHEVLVVRSTKVSAFTLDAATNLKLVIRAGAGTNTIDKAHAAGKGIRVCNVPGSNAIAVSELVMGLIIAIDRHIVDNANDIRQGLWNKKVYSKARGLYGQTIGILGLGEVGFAVVERAHAFGMPVFTVAKPDRSENAENKIKAYDIVQLGSQQELLNTCDIVSLHIPVTENTTRMVNQSFLTEMKDGAILINSSRGDLVDEAALIDAMNNKGIRAGLDVYDNEPGSGQGEFNSAVAKHPNVYGTHHIGASTEQAQIAVASSVISVIKSYQDGHLINCVNG